MSTKLWANRSVKVRDRCHRELLENLVISNVISDLRPRALFIFFVSQITFDLIFVLLCRINIEVHAFVICFFFVIIIFLFFLVVKMSLERESVGGVPNVGDLRGMPSAGSTSSDPRSQLLQEMREQNFDLIRFASYRTACKLRYVQKKCNCE